MGMFNLKAIDIGEPDRLKLVSSREEPDQTFDLLALAGAAETAGRFADAQRDIQRYTAIRALVADLTTAQACLDVLAVTQDAFASDPDSGARTDPKAIVSGALLWRAILLYCKASDRRTAARRGFNVSAALDPAQLRDHATIMELRDRGMISTDDGFASWLTPVLSARADADGGFAFRYSEQPGIDIVAEFTHILAALIAIAQAACADELARRERSLRECLGSYAHSPLFRAALEAARL